MTRMNLGRWAASLLLALFVMTGVATSHVRAQGVQPVTWETYDVNVEINEDGTLRVTESVQITFDGRYSTGTRTIPMDRIEEIDDVDVSVGTTPEAVTPLSRHDSVVLADPGTFITLEYDGEYTIEYRFEPTTATDNQRVVQIAYTVHGAIRDYPDANPPEQQLRWTAISSEVTGVGPVESASATVIFPQDIPDDRLAIDPQATSVEPDRVTWETGSLGEGDSLMVAVAFEPVTTATAPSWQASADSLDFRSDVLPGINIVIGLAALIGSTIMLLVMTVRGIRDPDVGLVSDILTERPDDLPAPLVGALIDERVDTRDALAALFELQQRGIISISETDGDATIRLETPVTKAPAWYRPMLEGLFSGGVTGEDVPLEESMTAMRRTAWYDITTAWEDELFARGLYAGRPKEARSRWMIGFLLLDTTVVAAVVVAYLWADEFTPWAIFPIAVAAIVLVAGLSQVRKAAMKTREGAIVAATWRAYGRYLDGLRKGADTRQFLDELERGLPWAIALGFDSPGKWKELEPSRQSPARTGGRPVYTGQFSGGYRDASLPNTGGGFSGIGGGGLQGASGATFSAIAGGSVSLMTMLNSAAAGFEAGAASSSSGSGGSSGGSFSGSSFSGSSGGGGHSFR